MKTSPDCRLGPALSSSRRTVKRRVPLKKERRKNSSRRAAAARPVYLSVLIVTPSHLPEKDWIGHVEKKKTAVNDSQPRLCSK